MSNISKSSPLKILILGASYGSLLAIKCLAAGHNVTMTCRTTTANLINAEGIRVRLPIKGRRDVGVHGLLEVASKDLTGRLSACTPQQVTDLAAFDLVVLAMQEPQYRQDGIRELMQQIALAKLPCLPIMNMPPLPYLARLMTQSVEDSDAATSTIDLKDFRAAYAQADVWDAFDPASMTLSSPDPQAFRPVDEPVNVLQVALPTNFKVARFASEKHTQILQQLEEDIEAVRYIHNGEALELPVKLKVFDSLFVPLAKWSMLLTGNYRCIQSNGVRPIKEAVLSDPAQSRNVYEWVAQLCVKMGASPDDLVPFDKYAAAAEGLAKPSSAARALAAGATHIERVDMIVKTFAMKHGMQNASVNETVDVVNSWLAKNRAV